MSRAHEDDAVLRLMAAPLGEQLDTLARWGLPQAGLLILMSRCLGRCFFCAQPVVTHPPPELITKLPDVLTWLDGNRAAGATRLCLGGTEPATHPGFYPALRRAAEVGFTEVELMTSAVQLSNPLTAKRFLDHGVRELCAPIYGATAVEHDAIVQVHGHFESLIKGLDHAFAEGMTVHLHTLALRRTLAGLPALAALVRARTGRPLTVAPLRPKDMFDYAREAVGFGALVETLRDADVSLVGFPACVLPEKPRTAPLLIEIYFRGQETAFAPECAGCVARPRCPGVVATHLALHGAAGLTPARAETRR